MDWKDILSERQRQLEPGMIGELLKISSEDKSIISLGPGEPDFSSPKYIIDSAKKALSKKETHYSPVSGRTDLKEAIVKKLKRENGIDAGLDNVSVGNGSTESIFQALLCLVDPGEEVLIPDPGFLDYIPAVQLLNGYPVSVPLREEDNFEFTAEGVKAQIKDPKKVKALIINTPGNPTGTVLSRKSLEELADIAIEHDIMILSDEAYEKLVYDDAKHISIGSLNGMQNHVVTLQTFSKTFAMPGFRVGYAVGPEPLIKAMNELHVYTSLAASTVSQIAAAEAMNNTKEYKKSVETMRKSYDKRRRFMVKRIGEINGFSVNNPKGAFYAFSKIDFSMKSVDFARWLIKNAKVSVVPGTEFGRFGEGYVRFSYATDIDLIKKGMDRIEKAVSKLK